MVLLQKYCIQVQSFISIYLMKLHHTDIGRKLFRLMIEVENPKRLSAVLAEHHCIRIELSSVQIFIGKKSYVRSGERTEDTAFIEHRTCILLEIASSLRICTTFYSKHVVYLYIGPLT